VLRLEKCLSVANAPDRFQDLDDLKQLFKDVKDLDFDYMRRRLAALSLVIAIDTSDIPELDARFWKRAKVELPRAKQAISIRLDADVLAWFKAQGRGYQSIINSVLKSFVDTRKGKR